jgi:hypothetical protein
MKQCFILAAGLLAFAALPTFAAPISFPECPAVGHDTSGCELLITVTAVNNGTATAFTVATSSPDLGPFDGSDDTLIGVLNSTSGTLGRINFRVAPGIGSFAFDGDGACKGTGSPLVSIYSPGPAASQCLQGQFQLTDAMDYASFGTTFTSFNLATAGFFVGGTMGGLPPGASSWFSLPGVITAGEITVLTPEPASLWLLGVGLIGLAFLHRHKAI